MGAYRSLSQIFSALVANSGVPFLLSVIQIAHVHFWLLSVQVQELFFLRMNRLQLHSVWQRNRLRPRIGKTLFTTFLPHIWFRMCLLVSIAMARGKFWFVGKRLANQRLIWSLSWEVRKPFERSSGKCCCWGGTSFWLKDLKAQDISRAEKQGRNAHL